MYKHGPEIAIFVGPTASGCSEAVSSLKDRGVLFLPPIAREDLSRLPDSVTKVLVVDGYFGHVPAVGHAELLNELTKRQIFGCSSLGAIRAYELRQDGMVGIGCVYEAFFAVDDFMDDEVALEHAPDPLFWPLSVPLVNVRAAMNHMVRSEGWNAAAVARIIAYLKAMYFGKRTLQAVSELTAAEFGSAMASHFLQVLPQFDLKKQDFLVALSTVAGMDLPSSPRAAKRLEVY